jgi:hypothetical protein
MADDKATETQNKVETTALKNLTQVFTANKQNLEAVEQQVKLNEKNAKLWQSIIKSVSGNFGFSFNMEMAEKSIAIYNQSVLLQLKLSTLMKQRTNATDQQIGSITKLATEQQKTGVIDDDVLIAGTQQLTNYLTQTNSIKLLLPVMGDLLAAQMSVNATSKDAVEIGSLMGEVFNGQVEDLKKLGLQYNESQEKVLRYGTEQQKAAMLAEIVNKNMGHKNTALAKTDPGKVAQSNNLFNDQLKVAGQEVASLQGKGAQFVVDNWNKIQLAIEAVTIALLANKAATLAVTIAQQAGLVIKALSTAWTYAALAVDMLRKGETLAATAQWILNAAMEANPVGIVIAGLTVLIGLGYLLIKNWDKVKAFLINLWNGIKTTFSNALNFIWNLFDNKYIQAALLIFTPLIGLPVVIIKNWDKIKVFFSNLWNGITTVFVGAVEWIYNFVMNIWNKLKGIFDAIGGFFAKIFGGKNNQATIQIQSQSKGATAKVPKHAAGTSYHPGGLALVGEEGPELINLPRSSQVFSHSKTQSLLNGMGSGGAGITVNYSPQIIIQGNADAKVMKTANDNSFTDFERKFNALMDRRRRLSFAGG